MTTNHRHGRVRPRPGGSIPGPGAHRPPSDLPGAGARRQALNGLGSHPARRSGALALRPPPGTTGWCGSPSTSARRQAGPQDRLRSQGGLGRTGAKSAAYLLDPQGTLSRSYGAKTTPHMYVVNKTGAGLRGRDRRPADSRPRHRRRPQRRAGGALGTEGRQDGLGRREAAARLHGEVRRPLIERPAPEDPGRRRSSSPCKLARLQPTFAHG